MDRSLGVAILLEEVVRSPYRARTSKEIQPLQWSILRYLGLAPNDGWDLASVAHYAGVTPAPVSRAVKTLEDRGLIEKQPNREDRRAVSIRITTKGLEALGSDPLQQIAYELRQLPDDEFEAIARGLRKLVLKQAGSGGADGSDSDRRRRR